MVSLTSWSLTWPPVDMCFFDLQTGGPGEGDHERETGRPPRRFHKALRNSRPTSNKKQRIRPGSVYESLMGGRQRPQRLDFKCNSLSGPEGQTMDWLLDDLSFPSPA